MQRMPHDNAADAISAAYFPQASHIVLAIRALHRRQGPSRQAEFIG